VVEPDVERFIECGATACTGWRGHHVRAGGAWACTSEMGVAVSSWRMPGSSAEVQGVVEAEGSGFLPESAGWSGTLRALD
jgi:hypothetical protein